MAAVRKQVEAQRAALELARANMEQVTLKREHLVGNQREAATMTLATLLFRRTL